VVAGCDTQSSNPSLMESSLWTAGLVIRVLSGSNHVKSPLLGLPEHAAPPGCLFFEALAVLIFRLIFTSSPEAATRPYR
jgi:hypothetical protein